MIKEFSFMFSNIIQHVFSSRRKHFDPISGLSPGPLGLDLCGWVVGYRSSWGGEADSKVSEADAKLLIYFCWQLEKKCDSKKKQ